MTKVHIWKNNQKPVPLLLNKQKANKMFDIKLNINS